MSSSELPAAGATEATGAANVQRLPFSALIKRVGPSMILTGLVIGPGALVVAAKIGAAYGYSLAWLLTLIVIICTTFAIANHRIAMLTGMPLLQAINHYYGRWFAALVGIATVTSGLSWAVGNFSGTGMGVSLVVPVITWKVGAILLTVLSLYFVFKRIGVYKIVEKSMTVCVALMILAFLLSYIVSGGASASEVAGGLFVPRLVDNAAIFSAMSLINTTCAITVGMYAAYLGKEKKWNRNDLYNGVVTTDVFAHTLSVALIVGLVMFTAAVVLKPKGINVTSAPQLASVLAPGIGGAAGAIIGLAILGAAFSSLLTGAQRTSVLFFDGLGMDYRLENRWVRIGAALVMVFGAVVSLTAGSSPVELVFISQLCTIAVTPVAGIFIILLLLRKDIGEPGKRPTVLTAFMCFSYLVVMALTIHTALSMFKK